MHSSFLSVQQEEEARLYFVMAVWLCGAEQVGSHVNKLLVHNKEPLVIPASDLSLPSLSPPGLICLLTPMNRNLTPTHSTKGWRYDEMR